MGRAENVVNCDFEEPTDIIPGDEVWNAEKVSGYVSASVGGCGGAVRFWWGETAVREANFPVGHLTCRAWEASLWSPGLPLGYSIWEAKVQWKHISSIGAGAGDVSESKCFHSRFSDRFPSSKLVTAPRSVAPPRVKRVGCFFYSIRKLTHACATLRRGKDDLCRSEVISLGTFHPCDPVIRGLSLAVPCRRGSSLRLMRRDYESA